MIEGFDKEIDTILRKARESEFAVADNQNPHMDADEISAFAENALPERAKHLYTEHLADCDRCRKILSNIILLNSEAETVPAFARLEEKNSAPVAPWYRRLFTFPRLAYSLGGLVLVFGGLIVFTLLQSSNMEMSKMSNSAANSNRAPVSMSNTANKSNSTAANSMANTNSSFVYSTNTTNTTSASNSSVSKSEAVPTGTPQDVPRNADEVDLGEVREEAKTEGTDKDSVSRQNQPTRKKENEQNKVADSEASRSSVPREDQKPVLSNPNSGATTGETLSVNGKTFNRRNNVWYDSAYNNQATTDITRGTKDYKKLDQGLRQTVERLGGTVVIVWKSKAYRIQ